MRILVVEDAPDGYDGRFLERSLDGVPEQRGRIQALENEGVLGGESVYRQRRVEELGGRVRLVPEYLQLVLEVARHRDARFHIDGEL